MPQEELVCQEVKDLKGQRVAVVSQDLQAPLDLQEQRVRKDHRECLGTLVNQEKRVIRVQQGQEDEMDLRESGGILDNRGRKEEEDQGVRVVRGDPPELLEPTGQRVLLVSLEYLVTAETRDLRDLRGTEDRQDLVDRWVFQEKRAFQDFLDLVEKRDLKEK